MLLKQNEWFDLFGEPKIPNDKFENKWMVLWDVPDDINKLIPTIPNRIYCHKIMPTILEKCFRNIIAKGLQDKIKTWDGCYNVRLQRGSNSKWSVHSFGCAIDINAAWNGLGKASTQDPELVKCFTSEGFAWGGNWQRTDAMHFELSKEYVEKNT
jgi:hypothetical protein